MAEQLGVSPQDLRAAARHLDDLSNRKKKVRSSLQDALAAVGAAWGDDRIGDQFAKGPEGFVAQREWVFGSIDAKTDLLDHYAREFKRTADYLERQDQSGAGWRGRSV